jgi:phosphoserine phosphatase RsbU/P
LLTGRAPMEAELALLNRAMCEEMGDGRFVTFAGARLDPVARVVSFISAGHGPTLLCHAGGGATLLESSGLPLGVDPGERYERPRVVQLLPGDTLVLLSDGLIEAKCPAGRMLTVAPLVEEVARLSHIEHTAASIAQGLIDLTLRHTGDKPPEDDLTVVVMCATP